MKNTLFQKWFSDNEPKIIKELESFKNKQNLFIFSTVAIACLAFLIQLFVPIGLKISVLVFAIWMLLLLLTLSISPSFITAIKVFSKSKIQKCVGVFIAICCVLLVNIAYMAYKLVPFFTGGLKLFNES